MNHHPDDEWAGGCSAEQVITDMLVNANTWVGGALGICLPEDEDRAYEYLTERGLTGPRGGLTRKGVTEARRAQREWDERV